MIEATRPDPTVRPPSRYFNPVLPHIFMVFSPKYSEKRLNWCATRQENNEK